MSETGSATARLRRLDLVRHRMAERHLVESDDAHQRPLDQPVALHPAQRLLWLHQQRRPHSRAYNVTFVCALDGVVDAERLAEAVRVCAARQLLTATLYEATDDGVPVQRVTAGIAAEVAVLDHGDLTHEAFTASVADQLSARPFDLATESCLRVRILPGARRCALVVSVHHIMWDGPSLAAFFDQIGREYRGAGVAVPVQARDLVERDSDRWSPQRTRSLRYWLDTLRGPAPCATPRLSAVRDGGRVERAETFVLELGSDTCAHLRELCATTGATEFAVFVAALEIALSAHADSDPVGLATMMSWRATPGSAGLWANLGHTVRLRRHLDPRASFASVVGQVVAEIAAVVDHLDVASDEIEAAARDRPEVDTGISGLVLYQHYDGALDLPGVECAWTMAPPADVAYPFAVQGVRHPDALRVHCTFQRDVIAARDMRAVLDHLGALLTEAPAEATVECLRASSRHDTHPRLPRPEQVGTVLDLLEPVLASTSGPALVDARGSVDYPELDARSAALAATLRGHGVGPEDVVAVHLPRSAALAVALLAILRAGGAYLFVPTDLPERRVEEILSATAPRVVLVASGAARPAAATTIAIADDGAHDGIDTPAAPRRRDPRGRAAIYYTSGSTGQPKAVELTDAALAARVRWGARRWPVRPGEARLAKSKMSFIDGATEILEGLAHGALVAIADDRTCRDVQLLARFAARHRARHMMAVPTLLRALLELDGDALGFDSVVSTGEPLEAELVAALHRRAPALRIENSYGCTETAGDVTVGAVDTTAERPSVGTAAHGTGVIVLDRRLRIARPDALGEVYIRGPQVARGYSGRAGDTSTRFVADPYDPGARMYRTGDIGRMRRDGTLELLGRRDSQVKVRGNRVDTGEVASALRTLLGADAEVAVVADTSAGDTELVGCFATSGAADAVSVRRALGTVLPPYMVPARVLRVERIPLLPNGKVDRPTLVEQARARTGDPLADSVRPGEQPLLDIVRRLAGRADLTATDNVFEYGIDSIRAVSLVRRARTEAALRLDVEDVFLEPTVRALVALATPVAPPAGHARPSGSLTLPWTAALLRRDEADPHDAFTFVTARMPSGLTAEEAGRRLDRAVADPRFDHLRRRFTFRGRLWRVHPVEEMTVVVAPVADPTDRRWMTEGIDPVAGRTLTAAVSPGPDGDLLTVAGSALVATGSDVTALAEMLGGAPGAPPARPVEAVGEPPGTDTVPHRVAVSTRLPGAVRPEIAIAALFAALSDIAVLELDPGSGHSPIPLPRGHTHAEIAALCERPPGPHTDPVTARSARALFQIRTAPPLPSPRDMVPIRRPASGMERIFPITAHHHATAHTTVLAVAVDPLIGDRAVSVLADWSARIRAGAPESITPARPEETTERST